MVKFEVTLFCKLCIVNLETVMFVLKNAVCRYFPCPCDFFWSELDIHGFLITSDVLDSKPQGQNGNVDLLRMVFSTQRALSLPSKCCNWGMANHFNQGFLFLPSSLGLTRLEHGFVLSSLLAAPRQLSAATPPSLSFLCSRGIDNRRSVRISLISPRETSGASRARFCIMFWKYAAWPKISPGFDVMFSSSCVWNSSAQKTFKPQIDEEYQQGCQVSSAQLSFLHFPRLLRRPAELTASTLPVCAAGGPVQGRLGGQTLNQ